MTLTTVCILLGWVDGWVGRSQKALHYLSSSLPCALDGTKNSHHNIVPHDLPSHMASLLSYDLPTLTWPYYCYMICPVRWPAYCHMICLVTWPAYCHMICPVTWPTYCNMICGHMASQLSHDLPSATAGQPIVTWSANHMASQLSHNLPTLTWPAYCHMTCSLPHDLPTITWPAECPLTRFVHCHMTSPLSHDLPVLFTFSSIEEMACSLWLPMMTHLAHMAVLSSSQKYSIGRACSLHIDCTCSYLKVYKQSFLLNKANQTKEHDP